MGYTFRYDLTDFEKLMVRLLVERGLAKYGVACCVDAGELKAAMGKPEVSTEHLASTMESLHARSVSESRGDDSTYFPIFDTILTQGVYPDSARWSYKFSRRFLQFRLGRNL